MAGYVRQSTADIIPTATVRAAPINAEYNALRDAFAASGGHKHDGTSGEGEYVPLIADLDALNKVVIDTTNNRVGVFVEVSAAAVEQIRIQDGVIVPVTDNDIDLGTSSVEFKDLYLDGTAYIDTLAVHESATITSNFSVNGNTTLGNAASDTVTFTADIASAMLPSADNTHDLGAVGSEWRNLYIDGTANIDALIADTATISAGTIDNTVIGGSTAVAGSFSTISSSGATTLASLTVSGATALNGGLTLDTNKFTVADTTGNTAIAGTLDVTGATTVADFTATGTTVLPATSFGDNNITNVGNIALDSITADGSSITITGNTTFADGAYDFDVASHDGSNGLKLAGTLVTSSAAELNKLDGATVTTTEINILDGDTSATSTTVADADRVVMNDNGTMVQVAVTDLAAYFDDEITAMPNLVTTAATTVGALNSGSITSGFGSIDTGSSTITTTGNITGGNVIISDGGNIGSASDTDAIAIASNGNVTLSQNLTVSGDLQVDGTTTTVNSNNLSVDDQLIELGNGRTGSATGDSGIVIERGSDANAFIGFDESADKFTVGTGTFTGTSTGDLSITTGTLVANIEGNVTGDLTGNANTATALETARTIAGQSFDGTANISIATTDLTSVTATAAEVNIMDGDTAASSTTLADADRVVVNDAGTMKQVALTDFETYFESALDTLSNVTTVGTLNSGSITSGFGSIDNGSSAITTTGTITFGTLSDGSDSVTDIVTSVGSGSANSELPTALAVENRIQAVSAISNNVTGLNATGAELNAVADVSAITIDTSTAIANNDGIAVFDSSASAIGYFDVDLLDTYFAGTTKTLTNKTLTSPTVSGLYLSDAGFIVEGSSADGNESTVTFTNPTADRTITFPDATGTVALSGQNVSFGTVTTSGDLLVGKTNLDTTVAGVELRNGGQLAVTKDGSWVGNFNRKTSDGDIVSFQKDGISIGTLGSNTTGGQSLFDIASRSNAASNMRFLTHDGSSLNEHMRLSSSGLLTKYGAATFNEGGVDADFRIESDGNTHMLFVDAGNNVVGINTNENQSAFALNVLGGGVSGGRAAKIKGPDTNTSTSTSAPQLVIANSNSTTNNFSALSFAASGDGTTAFIGAQNTNHSTSSGDLYIATRGPTNGYKNKVFIGDTSMVINEDSADYDFRVESNSNANMFFIDGGNDILGVGMAPDIDVTLSVGGAVGTTNGSAASPTHTFYSDPNTGMFRRGSDQLGFSAGGTESVAVTSTGIFTDIVGAKTTNANLSLKASGTGSVIVNEDGADRDFRVESDNEANMLFLEAANDRIFIAGGPDSYDANKLNIRGASVVPGGTNGNVGIYSTDNMTSGVGGSLTFGGRYTTGGTYYMFGGIQAVKTNATSGQADGTLKLYYVNNANATIPYHTANQSAIQFNPDGNDVDFRVESDSNANMLFVDAGNNQVNIGTTTNYGSVLNVFTTGTDALEIVSDNGNANAGPYLDITRKSSSPADGDFTGAIRFLANSDAAETIVGSINTRFDDVSNASEDTAMFFKIRQAGAQPNVLIFQPTETVVNEDGYDRDFRVESDTETHALFVDASTDRVGIKNSSPSYDLDIGTTATQSIGFGWMQMRTFTAEIPSSGTRWYKIANYTTGSMLEGQLFMMSARNGGADQTNGARMQHGSLSGYNNTVNSGDWGDVGTNYGHTAYFIEVGTDTHVYLRVNGSIYGGQVYGMFQGRANWTFDGSYVTSAP